MFNKETKKELLNEFKKLIDILDKENIWYSITAGTLLGAVHFEKMIDWDDDIDIMIDVEGYKKLISKYRNNIVVSNDEGYPLLFPKWVPDRSKISTSSVFVDLFVVVRTNRSNIKKYRSVRNQLRFGMYSTHHHFHAFNFGIWIWKVITWPFALCYRKNLDFDEVVSKLEDKNGDLHMIIANPTEKDQQNIIPDFTKESASLVYENMHVKAIKNYEQYLEHRYHSIYFNRPAVVFEHTNAYNIRRVKNRHGRI